MIKVTVIAVGRLKEKYLTAACDEYLKRLSAYSKVNVVEINEERCSDNPSNAEIAHVIEKEGERIISKIPKGSYVIPLCIEGSQLSSEDFSKKLETASLSGFGEVTFIIGGSVERCRHKRCDVFFGNKLNGVGVFSVFNGNFGYNSILPYDC